MILQSKEFLILFENVFPNDYMTSRSDNPRTNGIIYCNSVSNQLLVLYLEYIYITRLLIFHFEYHERHEFFQSSEYFFRMNITIGISKSKVEM